MARDHGVIRVQMEDLERPGVPESRVVRGRKGSLGMMHSIVRARRGSILGDFGITRYIVRFLWLDSKSKRQTHCESNQSQLPMGTHSD